MALNIKPLGNRILVSKSDGTEITDFGYISYGAMLTRIAVIAMTTVCLLGCKQEKKGLHDPLLRQQLTMMVSSLNDEDVSAVKKAMDDLYAIISVNWGKMSEEQKEKLSQSLLEKLSSLSGDIKMCKLCKHNLSFAGEIGRADWAAKDMVEVQNYSRSISEKLSEVKKTISELAATF